MSDLGELYIVDHPSPIMFSRVKDHQEVKQKILDSIDQMGRNIIEESHQLIKNSDWYLPKDIVRPYTQYAIPSIIHHNKLISRLFNSGEIVMDTCWFQQYGKGDHHGWHVHASCMFTNIYYVDLGEGTPKTSLRIINREFNIPIEEGMILTIPSFIQHCSKPNKTNYTKTVISYNSDLLHVLDP